MTAGDSRRDMLRQLFESTGLDVSGESLAIVSELHATFADQRARLSGVARAGTEPMIIPAFDRIHLEKEANGDSAN